MKTFLTCALVALTFTGCGSRVFQDFGELPTRTEGLRNQWGMSGAAKKCRGGTDLLFDQKGNPACPGQRNYAEAQALDNAEQAQKRARQPRGR